MNVSEFVRLQYKNNLLIKRGVAHKIGRGPISIFVCSIINYLYANFGAFITKCTIFMLCHYTIERLLIGF